MVSRILEVTSVAVDFTIGSLQGVPFLKVGAKGLVNSTGWKHPELGPWVYIVAPEDGVLDLDFLAEGPGAGDIVGWAILPIEVSLLLPIPGWVKGVRVHSSTNEIVQLFDNPGRDMPDGPRIAGEGLPLPWPFPWYTPKSTELS